MPGWTAKRTTDRSIRPVGWMAAFGLMAGWMAGGMAVTGLDIKVYASEPPEKVEKVEKVEQVQKEPDVDDRPPLPEGDRSRLAERIRYPNPDRAIFAGRVDPRGNAILGTGIVDFEEIASEKQNRDEYQAWNEVIQHAKSFSTTDLEEFARRDLTRDDLLGYGPLPRAYRVNLLRFEGRLTRVRRLPATKTLQEAGTKEIYEAQLVAQDGPPTEIISVVFSQLPQGLAAITQATEEQWVDVNVDAVAAGYFFKVKQASHSTEAVPVLIGKSVTLLQEKPAEVNPKEANPKEANPKEADPSRPIDVHIAIDTGLQVFRGIRDDTRAAKTDDSNWQEAAAWNRVLLHARRFSPEELEANARNDLRFADLFEPVRRDYKLQLVRFEGRLLLIRKMEASKKMLAAGIEAGYEGWLVPKDEPRGNPICIVFTELPEGVAELGRMSKWVSFAGYSFKLLRYESGETDKNDSARNVTKRAPMLIGRSVILRPDPDGPSKLSWDSFVTVALVVIGGILVTAGGITLWFRLGDVRARREINSHRSKNPFDGSPQTSPGLMAGGGYGPPEAN